MKHPLSLVSILVLAACVSGPFPAAADEPMQAADVAAEVAQADLVAFGEEHQTPAVHRRHHELLRELFAKRPQMVIAMEMFERDVQPLLDQYLKGEVDEAAFLAGARPWPNYARDYRPVIEFAKQHGIAVLAANAPRDLAKQASKEGVAKVLGDANVAASTTAPMDAYWNAFRDTMKGHEGMLGPGGMERFYAAQCLKDDTMAESIARRLSAERAAGRNPLVVLVCGKFHSDAGLGTVARVKQRVPGLVARVFSVESVPTGIYRSPGRAGEFTLVVGDKDTIAAPELGEAKPAAAAANPAPAQANENPEGLRPALGLMPAYGAEGPGVTVEGVRDGGSAAKAGIREGDRIIAVGDVKIADVEHYAEVLDGLRIGTKVAVRIQRGQEELQLEVEVASRSR